MSQQGMNTYRVYVLNTAQALSPAVVVAYIQAPKYGDAWKGARARLGNEGDKAKAVSASVLFSDPEGNTPSDVGAGDHLVVAKIDDIRPRNVKLDKTALQDVLNDTNLTPEERLARATAMVAGRSAPSTPAPAASTGGKSQRASA